MRVVVDRDRCVGAGLCVLTLPSAFDQSEEDGRVIFLGTGSMSPLQADLTRQAARLCPSGAVSVAEEEPAGSVG
ncbi:MAG TPA: ferredoxin [Streptosporangiaceae bacterium]|jgi:ferredoxin